MSANLPFERGTTYWGGDSTRVTSHASINSLLGRTYKVEGNSQRALSGKNPSEVTLMVVQNLLGRSYLVQNSTATTATDARGMKGLKFATGTGAKFNGQITSCVNAVGEYGVLPDDAYSGTTIINKDLFYVVVEGPCRARIATGETMTAGKAVHFNASGKIQNFAAASTTGTLQYSRLGFAAQTVGAAATSKTSALVYVGARYPGLI